SSVIYHPALLACYSFLFPHPSTTYIYTLSLHDALPILQLDLGTGYWLFRNPEGHRLTGIAPTVELHYTTTLSNADGRGDPSQARSEEHTSELQSRGHLVCRLLLEKKKK